MRATIGICGPGGGRGTGLTEGLGVGLGPRTPSSAQPALDFGWGVDPIMPSALSIVDEVASVAPGMTLVPFSTSARSNPVPFKSPFCATRSSLCGTLAACARLICMICGAAPRTSMDVANDSAIRSRRETEDAMRTIRCVNVMVMTSALILWRTKERLRKKTR